MTNIPHKPARASTLAAGFFAFLATVLALSTPTHAQSSLSIIPNFAVRGISADGRHASGTYYPSLTSTAVSHIGVWHADSGLEVLPIPDGAVAGVGNGISGDGRTVTGYYRTVTNSNVGYAVKRTEGEPLIDISYYHTPLYLLASGNVLNHDGSVAAGQSWGGQRRGYLWENGQAQYLGFPPGGGTELRPRTLSADGRILFGDVQIGRYNPFIWTESTGFQSFPTIPNYTLTGAIGMSSVGDVFLTTASGPTSQSRGRVVLWRNGTPTLFPLRSNLSYATDTAYVLSGDGRVVVGADTVSETEVQYYRWTEETGKVSLLEYWAQNGISLPQGLQISAIYGISQDGLTITGQVSPINPDPLQPFGGAFVATVPTCTTVAPFGMLLLSVVPRRQRPRERKPCSLPRLFTGSLTLFPCSPTTAI